MKTARVGTLTIYLLLWASYCLHGNQPFAGQHVSTLGNFGDTSKNRARVLQSNFQDTCNTMKLRNHPFIHPKKGQEENYLYVFWKIDVGIVNTCDEKAEEMGRYIGQQLQQNIKPSVANYVDSVNSWIEDLENRKGRLAELSVFEQKIYCYLKFSVDFYYQFQEIILQNEPRTALKKILDLAHSNGDRSRIFAEQISKEEERIDKRYGFRRREIADYYFERGKDNAKAGNYEEAVADFDTVILAQPSREAYYNRGLFQFNLKHFSKAIADYSKAIEIDSSFADAYFGRAKAKRELQDNPAALKDFGRAIRFNPSHAEAYFNRARVKDDAADHWGAIADYSKAIDIDPSWGVAFYNRAIDRFLVGLSKEGCRDLARAAELGVSNAAELQSQHCK